LLWVQDTVCFVVVIVVDMNCVTGFVSGETDVVRRRQW